MYDRVNLIVCHCLMARQRELLAVYLLGYGQRQVCKLWVAVLPVGWNGVVNHCFHALLLQELLQFVAPFGKYGKMAYGVRMATDVRENLGCCLSPFHAFLNILGMETLGLRMERICEGARSLAETLARIPELQVRYPTLPGNPYRELSEKQFRGRGGGIFTFRAGSKQKAFDVMNHLRYAARASNIGDLRTLVIHPASTLYIHSSEEERRRAGVFDDTVRVSVGIEDPDDLIPDFTEAIRCCL